MKQSIPSFKYSQAGLSSDYGVDGSCLKIRRDMSFYQKVRYDHTILLCVSLTREFDTRGAH